MFFFYMTKIDLFSLSILNYLSCFVFLEPVFFTIVGKNFFFLHSWSNNQLSCGILWKIFKMRAGDYERIINYDWPYHYKNTLDLLICHSLKLIQSFPFNIQGSLRLRPQLRGSQHPLNPQLYLFNPRKLILYDKTVVIPNA